MYNIINNTYDLISWTDYLDTSFLWNREWLWLNVKFNWIKSLSYDKYNNKLLVSDYWNSKIRTIDLVWSLTIPKVVKQMSYNIWTEILQWWLLNWKWFRANVLFWWENELNVNKTFEIEIKKVWDNFDWENTYKFDYKTSLWDYVLNFDLWEYLEDNTQYKWRYRVKDYLRSDRNSEWQYYGWLDNNDVDFISGSSIYSQTYPKIWLKVNSILQFWNELYITIPNSWVYRTSKLNPTHISDFEKISDDNMIINPNWITIDELNKILYVSDSSKNWIYSINLTTKVNTLIAWSTVWDLDDIWIFAQFNNPRKILLSDDNNIIYIVDNWSKIRKLNLLTKTVKTLLNFSWDITDIDLDKSSNIIYFWTNWNAVTSLNRWVWKFDLNSLNSPLILFLKQYNSGLYATPIWISINQKTKEIYIAYRFWNGVDYGSFISVYNIKSMSYSLISWIDNSGSNLNWYLEGTWSLVKYSWLNSLIHDKFNNKLYVADTWNSKIRSIELWWLTVTETPLNLAASTTRNVNGRTIQDADNKSINSNALVLEMRVLNTKFKETKAEIEIKKVTQPFDGQNTFFTSTIYMDKDTNDARFVLWDVNLDPNSTYHIRARAIDIASWNTSAWYYHLWNKDIWMPIPWNTGEISLYSDDDIYIPNYNVENNYRYILWEWTYFLNSQLKDSENKLPNAVYNYNTPYLKNVFNYDWFIYTVTNNEIYKIKESTWEIFFVTSTSDIIRAISFDKTNWILYIAYDYYITSYDLNTWVFTEITSSYFAWDWVWDIANAKFNLIKSIALSNDKKTLFIADSWNHKVKKINIDITSSDYKIVSLVIWSWNTDATKDSLTPSTGSGFNIFSPNSLYVLNNSNDLIIASNSAANAKIYRVNTTTNNWYLFRSWTSYDWVTWFKELSDDTNYIYYIYAWEIYKFHKYINLKNDVKIFAKSWTYDEWVAWTVQTFTDYSYDTEFLYFIDSWKRLRKKQHTFETKNTLIWDQITWVNQQVLNGATYNDFWSWIEFPSQTFYLETAFKYPYLNHVQTEIEIKKVWQNFDWAKTYISPWFLNTSTTVAQNLKSLISQDYIESWFSYHWRVRIKDVNWNFSWWHYPFWDNNTQVDFKVWPIKVWQTNAFIFKDQYDATYISNLPEFKYNLLKKDASWDVEWIYYVWLTEECIKYFDYKTYFAERMNISDVNKYTTNLVCDQMIKNINWPLKFSIDKNSIISHTTNQIYKTDFAIKNFARIAWTATAWDVSWLPLESSFNWIVDLINYKANDKCIIVVENWANKKVKIFPIDWTPSWCKWMLAWTDNWWVETMYNHTSGLNCIYESKLNNYIYFNWWKIDKTTYAFTPITWLNCIDDTVDDFESESYTYSNWIIYKNTLQSLSSNLATSVWISGEAGAWYYEWWVTDPFSKFTNITMMFKQTVGWKLKLVIQDKYSDHTKMRFVDLNAEFPPVLTSLSKTEFKTLETIKLTWDKFIEIWSPDDRRLTSYELTSWKYYILMWATKVSSEMITYWWNKEIELKVPLWTKLWKISVTTPSWISDWINYEISNEATITTVDPLNFLPWVTISITWDYFGETKETLSKVQITNGSWSYWDMEVISWSDKLLRVKVPLNAQTGNIKVITKYWDSNLIPIQILVWRAPNKPLLNYPDNGMINASLTPTLNTKSFVDLDENTHKASEWKVFDQTTNNLVYQSWTDVSSLTTKAIPSGTLTQAKTYLWQVRFMDNTDMWSEWSDVWAFTTAWSTLVTTSNLPPVKPVNQSPSNNSKGIDIATTLTFRGSTYLDWDEDEAKRTPQSQSVWFIKKLDWTYSNPVYRESVTTWDKTQYVLGANRLQNNIWYCWKVQYIDWESAESLLSDETCFYTWTEQTQTPPPSTGWWGWTVTINTPTDVPKIPIFWISNNPLSYSIDLTSEKYIDSWLDTFSWSEDKLEIVEWQIGNSNTDFSSAKRFRSIRSNCPSWENDLGWDCLLKKNILYKDIWTIGTLYVRTRHMDQYWIWSEPSIAQSFTVDALPSNTLFWNIRSIADLKVKVVATNMSWIEYDWSWNDWYNIVSTWTSWCLTEWIYKNYTHCLVKDNINYWYLLWKTTNNMKFEPLKKWTYKFVSTVKKWVKIKTETITVIVN